MLKKSLLGFFLCWITISSGKSITFSDSLSISILTVSPGEELYSVFGHSAIRVKDLKNKYDIVFNYGTFNFNTKGFYFKFAHGRIDYMLSAEYFSDFLFSCIEEQRIVKEQVLNLSKEQIQSIVNALIENYKPENRFYRYKFFTDNCATRIRDILIHSLPEIQWNDLSHIGSEQTFRNLYRPYLNHKPWILLGTEILLGSMTDQKAGINVMFLPDKLSEALSKAFIGTHALISNEKIIYSGFIKNSKQNIIPIYLFIIIIILSILVEINNKLKIIYDKIFFSFIGSLGLFILILSIVSAHNELHYNFNVLLFFPFLFIFPWIKSVKKRSFLLYLSLITITLSVLISPFILQKINLSTYILVFAIIIRLTLNILKMYLKTKYNET